MTIEKAQSTKNNGGQFDLSYSCFLAFPGSLGMNMINTSFDGTNFGN